MLAAVRPLQTNEVVKLMFWGTQQKREAENISLLWHCRTCAAVRSVRRRLLIFAHHLYPDCLRYPIKEPFVELMKGSLNTFLNAFTYPDRTCYPVASTNAQASVRAGSIAMSAWTHGISWSAGSCTAMNHECA